MKKVREGYKMTEIGEIPSEWNVVSTEEILVKDKNSIKIGPFGSQLKKEFLTEKGYKVYGQENVFSNDFKLGNRYINEERYNQLKTSNLLSGDLVISMMGTVGKTAIIPQDIEEGIMDSHLIRLRVDKNKYDKILLAQMIRNSDLIKKQIKKLSVGGIMEGLSSTIIKQLKFPLINIKEQEKIASILSTVDEQIDNVDALIEKNEELKKGLMQTLLSKGIGHKTFKKTEIGEIPEEWEVSKLEQLFYINTKSVEPSKLNEDILHYSLPAFDEFRLPVKQSSIEIKSNKYLIEEDSILVSKLNPRIKRIWIVNKVDYIKQICSTEFINYVAINKEKVNLKYFEQYFNSDIFQQELLNRESGSTGSRKRVVPNATNDINILVPNIFEQEKIASILSEIDKKIDEYENKKQKLVELKKGLMQQLLTGKIRVV